MWSDWKEKAQLSYSIPKRLLWDVDWNNFDMQKNKKMVVQRVIEYGLPEDYYAMFKLYGGVSGVRKIIKEIPHFRYPRDISFVCMTFNLKKEDLECYKRKQLREERMNS